ncbi:MAG: RNA methyltransferase [Clostridiales bacterium]|nr:RNA methyltransferase [Clostridiales bacterium]
METVTSRDNAALKSARRLRTKSGREKEGAFLAEGEKLIAEAVSAGLAPRLVLLRGAEPEEFALSGEGGEVRTLRITEALYDEIAGTVTPQAVMAVIEKPKNRNLPAFVGTALVLDRIQDPGNAGTMVRTAFAAGADAVLCVKGTADLWSDKAIRGAAGALFKLPVIEGLSAETVIGILREKGLSLFVLDAGGVDYAEADLTGSLALVVGNEGSGPSEVFRGNADAQIGIPMREGSESLNAGAAAAVVLYEKRRQETGVNKEL